MQLDNKNLWVAIIVSIAIVLGFEMLWNQPRIQKQRAAEAERLASAETVQGSNAPAAPGAAPVPGSVIAGLANAPNPDRASVIAQGPRVTIEGPGVAGSILLQGGVIDDLKLVNYRQTVEKDSPPVVLLSPRGAADTYFAEFGWVAAGGTPALPGADTRWTADRDKLTPATPVTLSWDNGQGLRFERKISIDDTYLFRIDERVTNTGAAPVTLHPFSLASRFGTPILGGYYILHEGPIGVFNEKLQEPSYSDLRDKKAIAFDSRGGWLGIVDKYWLVSLIPDQKADVKARFTHTLAGGADRYQVDYLGPAATVAPGQTAESTSRLFAGAKEVHLLDTYAERHAIPLFDRAIDFGWFYFMTKPMFLALDILYRFIGNFGVAIILFTVAIKILFFPLANKSYRSMAKMKLLQPEMEKLKEKYGEDRQRMSQEMMQLYKRAGANPLSGCLPILIQIPVFFALYKVLFVTIEMRHAPFYGWIHDLSAQDPTSLFNLFGLLPYAVPQVLHIGVWPIIMGITMFLQQKLNPQPVDPIQAKIFLALPFIFTVMLASFPAGLVIYWAVNNTLSIAQQWLIMKRLEGTPLAPPGKAKA
ncbi:MAG: membrane protein insertase YidC [Tagaea sp. CACIAM 22H2]|jgi:YidC/Oxa1 family membrane protein insertase|nr:membrane protein insertase YidC [Tagaea sp. CACIAM 22H2]